MDKPVPSDIGLKRPALPLNINRSLFSYSETLINQGIVISLKTRLLAIAIFLYFFIENGTLGLFPPTWYSIYRNIRLSDFILYSVIIYSFACVKEFRELYKSKSFIATKLVLFWLLFEFTISAVRYEFNVTEYFFRLKGIWSSFLIFPYLLLLKRNGIPFLIKIVLPVAIVSNILYILSAVTGIPFLPDVSIFKQQLPGGLEVYRVYGGTFYGDIIYLGFIYYWITKKFRFYQLLLTILLIIPHILAFGRLAWAFFTFTILVMIVMNSLRKREFKVLARQAIVMGLLIAVTIFCFIKFIPESDYYVDAINARIFQGQEDVKYNEGTYGQRVVFQNGSLVKLWQNNNILLGIGMHPMWVVRPESFEEQLYYNAFSDVYWAGVLAAYGIIGFAIAAFFQIYYIRTTFRTVKNYKETNAISFLLVLFLAKLLFDSFVSFSYNLVSVGLWGLYNNVNLYVAVVIYAYQKVKEEKIDSDKSSTGNGIFSDKTLKFNGLFKKRGFRK